MTCVAASNGVTDSLVLTERVKGRDEGTESRKKGENEGRRGKMKERKRRGQHQHERRTTVPADPHGEKKTLY